MQGTQSFNNLNKNAPDFFFFEVALLFLVARNLLKQIPIVSKLHHYTVRKNTYRSIYIHEIQLIFVNREQFCSL